MAVPAGDAVVSKTKGLKELTLSWVISDYNSRADNIVITSPKYFDGDKKWFMTLYPRLTGDQCGIFLNEVGADEIKGVKTVKFAIADSGGHLYNSKVINEPGLATSGGIGTRNFANAANIYPNDALRIRCEVVVDQEVKVKEEQLQGSTLSNDFGEILESNMFCDFKIKCNDKVYNCARIVLAARSKVFRAMFLNDMKEVRTGEIVIEDVRAEVMEQVVKFMYTDKVADEVLAEMADELLAVGHRYEMSGLKTISEKFLAKNVSVENAMDMLSLSKVYSLQYLKSKTIDFMKTVDSASIQL